MGFVTSLAVVPARFCLSAKSPTSAPVRARRGRSAPQMVGPLPDFGGLSGKFFKSEIVQNEINSFMEKQAMLAKLGQNYRAFDREGKIMYIDSSLELIDKWLILLQRFKLSDEFQCQLYVKQLETHLQSFGMTTDASR